MALFAKLFNMATQQTEEVEAMENVNRTLHPGFSNDKYSLLVIVGEHSRTGLVDYVVVEIERGNSAHFMSIVL